MQFAAHRGAQNDAGVLGVERAVGVARISQRLGGNRHRPLLALIHRGGHLRRHAEALPIKLKALDPAANRRVGLIGGAVVGVKIICAAPALSGRLGDAVALGEDILPKGTSTGRIRQNGADADNGDGAGCYVHRGASLDWFTATFPL